jgi:hypothetical protein
MSNLPQFFCIPFGENYRVFMNTISNSKVDIIWPLKNIDVRELTLKLKNQHPQKTKMRNWNDPQHKSFTWSFTGSNIKIFIHDKNLTTYSPILQISPDDKDKLPYNNWGFKPTSERFIDQEDTSTYRKAEPIHASALKHIAPEPSETKSHFPPHITKLILADSISKNETCPISCDSITYENATVTSCGHVFTSDAIKHWLSLPSSKGECPVCKQVCSS